MLTIIFNQISKQPTVENYNLLCQIAYDLTNLEYYSQGISIYYTSCATCGYTSFFESFWQLRYEVEQLINK